MKAAFAVDFAKAAIEVPLTAGKAASKAAKLAIRFLPDAGSQRLAIVFGDRELSAAITVQ
jgi:hypothetical protein